MFFIIYSNSDKNARRKMVLSFLSRGVLWMVSGHFIKDRLSIAESEAGKLFGDFSLRRMN
jgi:hypothetical protein